MKNVNNYLIISRVVFFNFFWRMGHWDYKDSIHEVACPTSGHE